MAADDARRREVQAAFKLYDADGRGRIPMTHLGTLLRALGHNPTEAQLRELEGVYGGDGRDENAAFDVEQLLGLLDAAAAMRPADYDDFIREAFKVFDKEETGRVDAQAMKDVLMSVGDKLTNFEADDLLRLADVDAAGTLDYEAFARVMLSRPQPEFVPPAADNGDEAGKEQEGGVKGEKGSTADPGAP